MCAMLDVRTYVWKWVGEEYSNISNSVVAVFGCHAPLLANTDLSFSSFSMWSQSSQSCSSIIKHCQLVSFLVTPCNLVLFACSWAVEFACLFWGSMLITQQAWSFRDGGMMASNRFCLISWWHDRCCVSVAWSVSLNHMSRSQK